MPAPAPAPAPKNPPSGATDELAKKLSAFEQKLNALEKIITADVQKLSTLELTIAADAQKLNTLEQTIAADAQAITANAQAITANAQALTDLTAQISHVRKTALSSIGHFLGKVPDGLKTTLTQRQHNLHLIAGILQVVFLLASFALYFVPNLGAASIVSGVTLAALISGIKNIVNPFLASYGDANIPTDFVLPATTTPPGTRDARP